MNSILLYGGITLITVVIMEFVAWFSHKYIMHGFLWSWHEDHHTPHAEGDGFFEKNDLFFLIFAIPSMACYILGVETSHFWLLFVGIGISIYGMIYFLIHDVYIHQRFKLVQTTRFQVLQSHIKSAWCAPRNSNKARLRVIRIASCRL